jgi:predicted O-methyltransferase YrrM
LREAQQLETLAKIGDAIEHAPPFPVDPSDAFRYHYVNSQYGYNDAIILHGMLRLLRPKRIIEIGSGFSSAVMLDTSERYLGGELSCTFIEPFTDRLESLLRPGDRERCRVYAAKVQDVDVVVFKSLGAGDILFIDSSHVVKYGSDLEHIFREVLPILAPGVHIHFHDVFYPFEYPVAWIELGHFWNECYMIRAFLANNYRYQIELFSDYLAHFHLDKIEAVSPLCLKNTGANLWLSKVT